MSDVLEFKYDNAIPGIKNIIKNSILENFRVGGRYGNQVFGGGDLKWRKSQRALKQSGQTLRDTGILQNSAVQSVIVRTYGNSLEITVGSNMPYAAIQNEGGKFKIPVTKKMKKFFWSMHYKERKSASKELRKIYKARGQKMKRGAMKQAQKEFTSEWMGMALSQKDSFNINIPARPFLVLQDEDVASIINFAVSKM